MAQEYDVIVIGRRHGRRPAIFSPPRSQTPRATCRYADFLNRADARLHHTG